MTDEGAAGDVAGALDWTFAGEGGSNGAAEGGMGSEFDGVFGVSRMGGWGTPATELLCVPGRTTRSGVLASANALYSDGQFRSQTSSKRMHMARVSVSTYRQWLGNALRLPMAQARIAPRNNSQHDGLRRCW